MLRSKGDFSLCASCRTHNSLDGEVVDLLAGVGPEELPVLAADLLATTRESVSGLSAGGEAGGGR